MTDTSTADLDYTVTLTGSMPYTDTGRNNVRAGFVQELRSLVSQLDHVTDAEYSDTDGPISLLPPPTVADARDRVTKAFADLDPLTTQQTVYTELREAVQALDAAVDQEQTIGADEPVVPDPTPTTPAPADPTPTPAPAETPETVAASTAPVAL